MAVFLAMLAERPFQFLVKLLINVLVLYIACFQIFKLVAHVLKKQGFLFFFFFPFMLLKLEFLDLFVFLRRSALLLITPINSCNNISLKGLHIV
jgi:hypothetical protein